MGSKKDYVSIGLKAGLKSFVPVFVGVLVGLFTTIFFAFAFIAFGWALVIGGVVGIVIGTFTAAKYLRKNNISNAVLIAILGTASNALLPLAGGLVVFVLLTTMLGKDNDVKKASS